MFSTMYKHIETQTVDDAHRLRKWKTNLKYIWTMNQGWKVEKRYRERQKQRALDELNFLTLLSSASTDFFLFLHDSPLLPLIYTIFSLDKALRTIMRKKSLYTHSLFPQLISITFSRYSLWQSGQIHHEQVERDMGLHCCSILTPQKESLLYLWFMSPTSSQINKIICYILSTMNYHLKNKNQNTP